MKTDEQGKRKARILVVDDEEGIRTLLRVVLEHAGYAVVTAGNGKEAWDLVESSPFDIVITDLRHYPIDGIEFIRMLRTSGRTLPVIIASACASVMISSTVLRLGGSAILRKPFGVDELLAAVEAALEGICTRSISDRWMPFRDPLAAPVVRAHPAPRRCATHEGRALFSRAPYERPVSVADVPLSACEQTMQDLYRVFRAVARHEMNEHNTAFARGEKKARIGEEDMPGMDSSRIRVEHFLNGPIPTSIVEPDGIIRINQYFIRLMAQEARRGLRGAPSRILRNPDLSQPDVLCDVYTSILYAVALHAIRGHFPINEWGFAVFQPDGRLAQGQRGHKYAYVNSLAILYYYVVMLEYDFSPHWRVVSLILTCPEMFASLSEREQLELPERLDRMVATLGKRGVLPKQVIYEETGLTREDFKEFLSHQAHPET